MTLYRAVSEEEFADLMATGVFRCPPGTLEVKWFAEELEHAEEWARRFAAADGKIYRVVQVELSGVAPPLSQRHAKLDGVGPAWWLRLEQLNGCVVGEVHS